MWLCLVIASTQSTSSFVNISFSSVSFAKCNNSSFFAIAASKNLWQVATAFSNLILRTPFRMASSMSSWAFFNYLSTFNFASKKLQHLLKGVSWYHRTILINVYLWSHGTLRKNSNHGRSSYCDFSLTRQLTWVTDKHQKRKVVFDLDSIARCLQCQFQTICGKKKSRESTKDMRHTKVLDVYPSNESGPRASPKVQPEII